ncbi:hypothetical protein AAEH95_09045 [Shewanella xiamenensis]|uniref:hypothetical protein n=1 Tax=Shewanella xiamenensis TaxID=332186 RepID=UPI00313DDC49
MKQSVKKGCDWLRPILVIICVSLGGCSMLPPPKTPCVATVPVLTNVIESDEVFIVSQSDMAQLTLYIEQLRQCVAVNSM